jgi:hypothetical protein
MVGSSTDVLLGLFVVGSAIDGTVAGGGWSCRGGELFGEHELIYTGLKGRMNQIVRGYYEDH